MKQNTEKNMTTSQTESKPETENMPASKRGQLELLVMLTSLQMDNEVKDFELINSMLLKILPPNQLRRVMKDAIGDIDYEFLGFVNIYYHLSKLIPLHFDVIDFGCAYNPQSFFFQKHKKFHAVDIGDYERFNAPNSIFYKMDIQEFIKVHKNYFDQDKTFAICSYVPSKDTKLVRENFKNTFVFYPA